MEAENELLEEVAIPCRWKESARASPIIHLRFSNELAGHGAGRAAALPSFHDSDAGHDMWSRTISCNEDSDNLPCVRLQWHPMRSASKIACAGRVGKCWHYDGQLATEGIGEPCGASMQDARPGLPSPRSKKQKWSSAVSEDDEALLAVAFSVVV